MSGTFRWKYQGIYREISEIFTRIYFEISGKCRGISWEKLGTFTGKCWGISLEIAGEFYGEVTAEWWSVLTSKCWGNFTGQCRGIQSIWRVSGQIFLILFKGLMPWCLPGFNFHSQPHVFSLFIYRKTFDCVVCYSRYFINVFIYGAIDTLGHVGCGAA